jgi:hypothetical protein
MIQPGASGTACEACAFEEIDGLAPQFVALASSFFRGEEEL